MYSLSPLCFGHDEQTSEWQREFATGRGAQSVEKHAESADHGGSTQEGRAEEAAFNAV
jgi:hypothetical protein